MQSISEETKQILIKKGYKVEVSGNMFWALNPEGTSIVRGPLYSADDAWKACYNDLLWRSN